MPESKERCLVALQDVVAAACMGIISRVFRAPATVVAPVGFLWLPLMALGGFALVGQHIALTTLCCGRLIYCAALITVRSGKATSG